MGGCTARPTRAEAGGFGTVYRLNPDVAGDASFQVLHSFTGASDVTGANPYGPLVLGADGDVYGTTNSGGAKGNGVVFQVTTGGNYTLSFIPLISGWTVRPRQPVWCRCRTTPCSPLRRRRPRVAARLSTSRLRGSLAQSGSPSEPGVRAQAPLVLSPRDDVGNLFGTTNQGGPTNRGTSPR